MTQSLQPLQQDAPIVVCALYKFVTLKNYNSLREHLLRTMAANRIRGTLLLAREGINGTVAGTRNGIDVCWPGLTGTPA